MQYVYGVALVSQSNADNFEVWREGFTEQAAKDWITQVEEVGGVRKGAFVMIRQPISQWERYGE